MRLLASALVSVCALAATGCNGGNEEQLTLFIVEVEGEGRVVSYVLQGDGESYADEGETCSSRCEQEVEYSKDFEFLSLEPIPEDGWYFDRWEDEGDIARCNPDTIQDNDESKIVFGLKGGGAVGCRAIFLQLGSLDVTTSVIGEGTVTTAAFDINSDIDPGTETASCPDGDCMASYAESQGVEAARLEAAPAPGWTFVRFETGDPAGLPCDETTAAIEIYLPLTGPGTVHCRAVFEMQSGSAPALSCDIPGEESGSCQMSSSQVADTFIITCDTEVGGLTVFDVADPATPLVTQTLYSGIQFTGAVQLADGTVVGAGRDNITPWVGRTDLGLNDHQWQVNFGVGLDRTGEIALLDATTVGVVHRGGPSFQLAKVTTAGVLTEEVTFNTGEGNPSSLLPLADGYVLAGDLEIQDLVEHDAVLLRVGTDDAPDWQKRFANGGRNSVSNVVELDDGKLLLLGATRGMGVAGAFTGYLALFSATGTLEWHHTYGTAGTVGFTDAVQTDEGVMVLGRMSGDLLLMELDVTDGSIDGAASYGVTGGGSEGALGLDVTSTGGFAIAATVGGAQQLLIVTLPDGTLPGCSDAAIGASADTSGITVATPSDIVITDSVFTSTSTTPASPGAAVPDPTSGACTPVNQCETE